MNASQIKSVYIVTIKYLLREGMLWPRSPTNNCKTPGVNRKSWAVKFWPEEFPWNLWATIAIFYYPCGRGGPMAGGSACRRLFWSLVHWFIWSLLQSHYRGLGSQYAIASLWLPHAWGPNWGWDIMHQDSWKQNCYTNNFLLSLFSCYHLAILFGEPMSEFWSSWS